MKRETKINLIFLAIILALMLPAAFRMYAKRVSDPERKPMSMPDPMRLDAVYIDPNPKHPSVNFVVPLRLIRWHDKILARQFQQHPPAEGSQWARLEGAESSLRTFELIAAADGSDQFTMYLLLWDQTVLPNLSSGSFELAFQIDGNAEAWQNAPVSIEAASPQPMPYEIRRELKNLGFINPPQSVMLIRLSTDHPEVVPDAIRLTLNAESGQANNDEINRLTESLDWQSWNGDRSIAELNAEKRDLPTDD